MRTAGERVADRQPPEGPDIVLSLDRSGDFYAVRTLTGRGRSWLQRNIPPAALTPEGELVIAPADATDLVERMRADGLRAELPGAHPV